MLVEVIVATLVLTVGLLALEGTAVAVERMIASGLRTGGAAARASSRLDLLRAGGCASLADGGSADDRYAERWMVSGGGRLRMLRVTIGFPDGSGTHTDMVEAAVWCP